jgi:hypothetical protein
VETWKLLAIENLGSWYECVTVPIMYAGILAIWQPEKSMLQNSDCQDARISVIGIGILTVRQIADTEEQSI